MHFVLLHAFSLDKNGPETQVEYKKSNRYEEMNSKVIDRIQPHAKMDFTDHKKKRHLVVLVVLPMGVTHCNTTNTDIVVGST